MMQASIDHELVINTLKKQEKIFSGRCLFCVPFDEDLSRVSWDSQGHMTRKIFMQKAQLLFTGNEGTKDFALGQKHETIEAYLKEFHSLKPCVHSSDAHDPAKLFSPTGDRFTWIKADPTFKGLAARVLNEPDTRVYIGKSPPQLDALLQRSTKIVRSVSIHKRTGSSLAEKWFDLDVPLNAELVAIIGNKGSGKSALADVLGLLGNTPRYRSFSFLSDERFRDKKNNKAKHFEASIIWADNKADGPMLLNDTPQEGATETVKYIPQQYLETICNEVGLGTGSQFYAELQKVIFSHVPRSEQLGFTSLDEPMARKHRSEETTEAIDFLVDQLRNINREIVNCEEHLTESHRTSLETQLLAKQRGVAAHELLKPKPVAAEPDAAVSEKTTAASADLLRLEADLAKISDEVQQINRNLEVEAKRRMLAERLAGKLGNLEKQFQATKNEAHAEVMELGLEWERTSSFAHNQ